MFVVYLVIEHQIYWLFITFQKNTPFNQLDQKKGQYQALEKKKYSEMKWAAIISQVISLVFVLLALTLKSEHMYF